MDCTVTVVKGSVAKLENMEEVVKKTPGPIKDVLNPTMVQRVSDDSITMQPKLNEKDSSFLDIQWADWKDVRESKARST
ncbi:hypothetical protein ACHAQI_011264 [Fusarium lateritium]